MVHECLERYVVGEDGLGALCRCAICTGCVCGRRIQFRQEESSLRATGVAHDETRKREPVSDEIL